MAVYRMWGSGDMKRRIVSLAIIFVSLIVILFNQNQKQSVSVNGEQSRKPVAYTAPSIDKERYIDRIPFAGMDERYINYTAAGSYTKMEKNKGYRKYYWCIGEYTVLTVKVYDVMDWQMGSTYDTTVKLSNVVAYVDQDFLDVAWTSETVYLSYRVRDRKYEYMNMHMPRFGPYYEGRKVTESDIRRYLADIRYGRPIRSSYDYGDYGYYDDFEDFYNDHYDDFDSYQEAEEYFDAYY